MTLCENGQTQQKSTEIYTSARFHAYLVLSPDEKQRHNLATQLAKQMLCANKKNDASCNACSDCIKIERQTHPDVIYIGKDAKTVPIKELRNTLEQAYLAPNEADGKVFVLSNADKLSEQCQNTLLKTIEEPPKKVKFILLARNKNAIIPTVLSRVCVISPQAQQFEQYLAEVKAKRSELEQEKVKSLAFFCMYYETELPEENQAQKILHAYELSYKFFSGQEKNPVLCFPLAKELLLTYMLVFMLVAKEVTYSALCKESRDFVFSEEKISNCCAKTSAKKAMAVYEIFQEAYLRLNLNANANAVLAYISQNI